MLAIRVCYCKLFEGYLLTAKGRPGYTLAIMTPEITPSSTHCPQCGQLFTCGAKAGDTACWCFDLPHIIPLNSIGETGTGCLCPKCLRRLIEEKQIKPHDTE